MQLLLEKNELLDLGHELRQVSVHCREGCCWLTVEGDNRDHILTAGHRHTIRQSGRVMVTALAKTRVQLVRDAKKILIVPTLRPCGDNC